MNTAFDFELPDLSWTVYNIPKPKKPGEFRKITEPNAELKAVQRRILLYLYSVRGCFPTKYAHGFVCKRNTSTGVLMHDRESPVILGMDIKDFFDTFPVDVVRSNLLLAGIPATLVDKIMTACTYKGSIPQGGPCSPALTNVGMQDMDYILAAIAESHHMTYSRYADDITMALMPGYPVRRNYEFMYKNVNYILKERLGLHLNSKKSHAMYRWSLCPREINGIVLAQDGKGYNAPRMMRKTVRAMLCNLAHELQASGGHPTDKHWSTWAKIVGYARYFDNIRSYSELERCGADPILQEKYLDYCKGIFE